MLSSAGLSGVSDVSGIQSSTASARCIVQTSFVSHSVINLRHFFLLGIRKEKKDSLVTHTYFEK